MKAIIWTKYGPPEVLQLQEIAKPVPRDNEILVRIRATTVETGDCELRRYQIHNWLYLPLRLMFGLIRPRIKILGQQLSGVVEAVGKDVSEFQADDEIFAPLEMLFGTYAEYICLSSTQAIANKPTNISHEEAATVSVGGTNALHFLRKAGIQPGHKVLIYGTTGSIGTFAVQLAKHFGAEVTGVCGPSNIELVKSLGADKVIDYTKQQYPDEDEAYDVVFDTIGKSPFSRAISSVKPGGSYLLANPTLREQLRGIWASLTSNKKVIFELASYHTEDLTFLKSLIEEGKLKPIIDSCYPLEQTAEAHRYVEMGHKKGNVVIAVTNEHQTQ